MPDVFSALVSPQARHAMLVHLPIVVGLVGVIPLLLAACCGFRSVSLRSAAITCYLLASGGAVLAAQSGRQAIASVRAEQAPLNQREAALLATHEARGSIAWVWPLVPAGLLGATFIPRRAVRLGAGSLALFAGVGAGAWIACIGHVGGRLVYEHGLGVPVRQAAPDDDGPRPDRSARAIDDD